MAPGDRLYRNMPELTREAAQLGFDLMRQGLRSLGELGFGIGERAAATVARSMFETLDVGELRNDIVD